MINLQEIRFLVRRKYDGKYLSSKWKWFDNPLDATLYKEHEIGAFNLDSDNVDIVEVDVSITSDLPTPRD